jgi:hypothetical protein
VADIKIRPILLHKGNVRLAIYGLGNIRDERLVQTFKANKVSALLIYISSFVTSFRQSPTPIHQNISEDSGTGVFPHFGGRSSPKGGSFTRDRANANKELFVDMFVFAPQLWGRFVLKTAFYLSLRTCRSRGCRRPMPTRTSTSSCCTRYKTLSINRHTLFRK